ncbi:hypothetical protein ACFYNO_31740 [Kitasatospora sp. NPDC006697]|uniref:hypothetical protein n=1 Tax=Kitasatospora sp. NPDC006697 TaxID=3364020 RepID=UPI0036C06A89
MTPDENLRALAALEAGFRRDEAALAALSQRAPDEAALPVLLAAYGVRTLDAMVLIASGTTDPAELDTLLQQNVTARMCATLGRTLTSWAAEAPDAASGDIARAVIDAILSFTQNGDESCVLPLLAGLRAQALEAP